MNEVRYPYKPKITVILLSMLFFVGCTLVLANVARTNDRGLILDKVIEFSPEGATIFYWVLTVASALFVLIAIMVIYTGLTTDKEIILTENDITAPRSGLSKKKHFS